MAITIDAEVETVNEGRTKGLIRFTGIKARNAWRRIKSFFKRTITKRNIAQAVYFTGTVALTYFVMDYFLPMWLNLMLISVVIIHEMTHFIVAVRRKQDPRLPFFVPWVYGITGATWIGEDDPVHGQNIALAGPLAGMIVSAFWGIGSAIVGFTPGIYAAAWVFAQQVFIGTFGGDGRRYKRYGKRIAADATALETVPA